MCAKTVSHKKQFLTAFYFRQVLVVGQDSSVGIVTQYGLDGPGIVTSQFGMPSICCTLNCFNVRYNLLHCVMLLLSVGVELGPTVMEESVIH
jgi:hypothetical protein